MLHLVSGYSEGIAILNTADRGGLLSNFLARYWQMFNRFHFLFMDNFANFIFVLTNLCKILVYCVRWCFLILMFHFFKFWYFYEVGVGFRPPITYIKELGFFCTKSCVSICLSVHSSDILLARRFVQHMIGRKGGEFSLSLINTNEVSSLSLTHTQIRRWVLTHSHTEIGEKVVGSVRCIQWHNCHHLFGYLNTDNARFQPIGGT
jgi:hypothetical protein